MRRSSRARADHDTCIGRRKIRGTSQTGPFLRQTRGAVRSATVVAAVAAAITLVGGAAAKPEPQWQAAPSFRMEELTASSGRGVGSRSSRGTTRADRRPPATRSTALPLQEGASAHGRSPTQRPPMATSPGWSARTSCSGSSTALVAGGRVARDEAPAERSARPAATRRWRISHRLPRTARPSHSFLTVQFSSSGSTRATNLRRSWCVLRRRR